MYISCILVYLCIYIYVYTCIYTSAGKRHDILTLGSVYMMVLDSLQVIKLQGIGLELGSVQFNLGALAEFYVVSGVPRGSR